MHKQFILLIILSGFLFSCSDQESMEPLNQQEVIQDRGFGCGGSDFPTLSIEDLPEFMTNNYNFQSCIDQMLGDLGQCYEDEIEPLGTESITIFNTGSESVLGENCVFETDGEAGGLMSSVCLSDLLLFTFNDEIDFGPNFPMPNIHDLVEKYEEECDNVVVSNISFSWGSGSAWPNPKDLNMSYEVGCCMSKIPKDIGDSF